MPLDTEHIGRLNKYAAQVLPAQEQSRNSRAATKEALKVNWLGITLTAALSVVGTLSVVGIPAVIIFTRLMYKEVKDDYQRTLYNQNVRSLRQMRVSDVSLNEPLDRTELRRRAHIANELILMRMRGADSDVSLLARLDDNQSLVIPPDTTPPMIHDRPPAYSLYEDDPPAYDAPHLPQIIQVRPIESPPAYTENADTDSVVSFGNDELPLPADDAIRTR